MSTNRTPEQQQALDDKFFRAATAAQYEEMGKLLKEGANIDDTNTRGGTSLLNAILAKNEDLALWLLDRGAKPTVQDRNGESPLIAAAAAGMVIALKKMVKVSSKEDLNIPNKLGATALMEACAGIHPECVRVLADGGAKVDVYSLNGTCALLIATQRQDFESVEILLKAKADPNSCDSYEVPALIGASQDLSHYEFQTEKRNSLKTVKALLKAGAKPNQKAKSGNTALAEASATWNKPVMELLLDSGADPNVHSTAGVRGEYTPLMMASLKHDLPLMKKILEKGGKINFLNSKGQTALGFAMMTLNVDEKELEKAAANAKTKEEKKKLVSDAQAAAQEKAREAIEYLLENKAILGPKQKIGIAHFAVYTDSVKLLKKAQEIGEIDFPDNEGHTALHLAFYKKHHKMAAELIECGANINAPDKELNTPAHMYFDNPGVSQTVKQQVAILKAQDKKELQDLGDNLLKAAEEVSNRLENLFFKGSVNWNAQNANGDGVLAVAVHAYANGQLKREQLDKIVEAGGDITLANENGDSPLHLAIKIGDVELLKVWVEKLKSENKFDAIESSLFDVAWTINENPKALAVARPAMEFMISQGAKIDYQDEDGNFPLLVATVENKEEVVSLFIELGANINQQNNEKETALIQAIATNRPNISRILIDKGIDYDLTTSDGSDAVSMTYKYNRPGILNQIVEARSNRPAPPKNKGF